MSYENRDVLRLLWQVNSYSEHFVSSFYKCQNIVIFRPRSVCEHRFLPLQFAEFQTCLREVLLCPKCWSYIHVLRCRTALLTCENQLPKSFVPKSKSSHNVVATFGVKKSYLPSNNLNSRSNDENGSLSIYTLRVALQLLTLGKHRLLNFYKNRRFTTFIR